MFFGQSSGSGSIISPDGTILTNYHVIGELVRGKSKGKVQIRKLECLCVGLFFSQLLSVRNWEAQLAQVMAFLLLLQILFFCHRLSTL